MKNWIYSFLFVSLLSGNVLAQPVKLDNCKIKWTPSDTIQATDKTIVEVGTNRKSYASEVIEIPCSDILKESDDVVINFYVEDSQGNISKGLKGLRVQVLDTTPPEDHKKACIDSVDKDDKPVTICIELTASLTFQWKWPTTNKDGTPLEDLAGFNFYYGMGSRKYEGNKNVGLVDTYKLEDSIKDMRYFAVTAYDNDENESEYSNEVRVKKDGTPDKISFFVAYDSRANPFPDWLVDDYINTGKIIMTDDVGFRVWGGGDNNGKVSIPGNMYGNPKYVRSNYFVLFDGEIENIIPNEYTVDDLVLNKNVFVDRSFKVTLIPEDFEGYKILQTRNGHKNIDAKEHLSFNIVN